MTRLLRLASAGETHPGQIRARNEDRFALLDPLGLFLVANGMGGAPTGWVAAALAVETVGSFFDDAERTAPDGDESALASLVDAVRVANGRIHERSRSRAENRGMGTTFAGVLVEGRAVCVAHVGDSRVYRLRQGRLDLLTEDHTFRNECVWRGMPIDQADALPNGHALTRALGVRRSVEVSARVETAQPGDVMMLCTDGISSVLDRRTIAALLIEAGDLGETARRFIARANDAGGPDNATVVLLRWT